MSNESVLTTSGDGSIMLTSHRIRYQNASTNYSHFISIMLDHVSSVEVLFTSNIKLLIAAIVFTLGGISVSLVEDGTLGGVLVIVGIALLVLFFRSRKHVISISSNSSKIIFHTQGISKEDIQGFILKLQEAQYQYIVSLKQ